MFWLSAPDERPPALPAVWLVATGASPRDLAERSLLRRALARRVVARWLDAEEDTVAIHHDPAGRPGVSGPSATGLHISLATRAGVVAVALAESPVGVDVEAIDLQAAPPLALLHRQERIALETLAPARRAEAFARIWAAKEAYVKALGAGFARPPESFAVTLDEAGRFRLDDSEGDAPATGETLLTTNGGQVSLAAAVIVLG